MSSIKGADNADIQTLINRARQATEEAEGRDGEQNVKSTQQTQDEHARAQKAQEAIGLQQMRDAARDATQTDTTVQDKVANIESTDRMQAKQDTKYSGGSREVVNATTLEEQEKAKAQRAAGETLTSQDLLRQLQMKGSGIPV